MKLLLAGDEDVELHQLYGALVAELERRSDVPPVTQIGGEPERSAMIHASKAPFTLFSARLNGGPEAEEIRHATHVILASCVNARTEWLEFWRGTIKALGRILVAEVTDGPQPSSSPVSPEGVLFVASAGSWTYAAPQLAARLAELFVDSNFRALPAVQALMAKWQEDLGPDVTLELDGSLVSDTLCIGASNVIDVDLRFLSDDPDKPGLIERVEQVTGLRYRKTIEVDDYPAGKSQAHLIEGRLEVAGLGLPLEIEGSLRNRRSMNWDGLYRTLFTPVELERYRRAKRGLNGNREEYQRFKRGIRTLCRDRALSAGLLKE